MSSLLGDASVAHQVKCQPQVFNNLPTCQPNQPAYIMKYACRTSQCAVTTEWLLNVQIRLITHDFGGELGPALQQQTVSETESFFYEAAASLTSSFIAILYNSDTETITMFSRIRNLRDVTVLSILRIAVTKLSRLHCEHTTYEQREVATIVTFSPCMPIILCVPLT